LEEGSCEGDVVKLRDIFHDFVISRHETRSATAENRRSKSHNESN
jgi:hypothetical protein